MKLALRFAVFAALALARAVRAQPADPERWLHEGFELRGQGLDLEAFELFTRAAEATHWPRAFAQLGLAEQALGRWAAADEHVRQALAAVDDPWIVSRRPYLEQAAETIAAHIAELNAVGPDGAELFVQGRLVGILPLAAPVRVAVGQAVVVVRRVGHELGRRVVIFEPHDRRLEVFEAAPGPDSAAAQPSAAAAPPTQPTPPPIELHRANAPPRTAPPAGTPHGADRAPARLRAAALGLGAGGLATLGLASGFAVLTVATANEVNHPAGGSMFDPSLISRGKVYQAAEACLFAVGGAGLVTGAILEIVRAHHLQHERLAAQARGAR
jgi:hypothetical protein